MNNTIKLSPSGMNITQRIETLTPAKAREFLSRNTRNRAVSSPTVARYRNDMMHGRWEFCADPIRFADDGSMIDGQHRCLAMAECPKGTSIPVLVIEGLPKDSQMAMDQGRHRGAGQQLGMRGVKNATLVAAGVKLWLTRDQGLLFRSSRLVSSIITKTLIEQTVFERIDQIERISEWTGLLLKSDAAPSVCYAAAMAFDDINPDKAREFFDQLASGGDGGRTDPIRVLDNRLRRERRAHVKTTQRDQLGLLFLTWNWWATGRQITKLQRPSRWTPENYPVPVAA
ncbi:hypothetical protein BI041_gp33 [Propionibacterium phage PFR2]|uniref:Uncharacterized protein n=2 Tax=Pulverervirus PFR1 TaxID=2170091 RepID=A0A173G9H6_9CAUD|nr:hypothetical protein [Propionibacterium freudenreichii]YP_009287707.1 hypothetical protein BI042_gp31 [Propionibacterium phage PFR1]YP_009290940.1 hypothetical protein BI041_gp33 [Propionibacterium phage PFR2]ANH49897.1 hypothetical protein PFR_31 [Propionibacterium phage PFR1]ANH49956.1 hypothetical protein PFR2_31 [Propionibacterium phage PFR2]MDK9674406.1 hypothetical protein [Propionibacterium freudenreichii]CEI46713.1 Putative uncharacterized protein [Propionibacterium freudenreichii]